MPGASWVSARLEKQAGARVMARASPPPPSSGGDGQRYAGSELDDMGWLMERGEMTVGSPIARTRAQTRRISTEATVASTAAGGRARARELGDLVEKGLLGEDVRGFSRTTGSLGS